MDDLPAPSYFPSAIGEAFGRKDKCVRCGYRLTRLFELRRPRGRLSGQAHENPGR